jgi:hypothetical protein
MTMAGYIALAEDWARFEERAQPVFRRHGINVLHAVDLRATKREFAEWTRDKKETFIAELFSVAAGTVIMGISVSVRKQSYKDAARRTELNKNISTYGQCFNLIINQILSEPFLSSLAFEGGLFFVVESGNENNNGLVRHFNELVKLHNLGNVLRSITFVPKDHCMAIQLADCLAFYSRRDGVAAEEAREANFSEMPLDSILEIMVRSLPHKGTVVTGLFADEEDQRRAADESVQDEQSS